MRRRTLLSAVGMAASTLAWQRPSTAWADETPGVSATEIKIGNTMPYSGPASSYGVIGRTDAAYFRMINDQGGINGRKIAFISLDDGYNPTKTVEATRRLVEQEQVAFIFHSLGSAHNTAIRRYLNERKVPQLFISAGADKFGDYKQFPWTIPCLPSFRTEAQVYAKYILANKPDAKVGILYQNDDFGKDYVIGVRDVLGEKFDKLVVKTATYEPTDPTIESQIVTLQAAGTDTLILVAIPKFAAQAIRKVYDIGWRPLFMMSYVASSVAEAIKPAGAEKAVGNITSLFIKDPTDPSWSNDPAINEWRAFMGKYLPGADLADGAYVYAYSVSQMLVQVLRQCGGDFSRENILRQATNLHDLEIPGLLPGIKVNTSPTNYHPIRQLQLARWNGKTWERFGEVIEGSGA